jgi:hypothetical protein
MNFRLPYPHVFSSLPDFVMGLAFLVTWIDPFALGDNMPQYLMLVMLLEFIIIHSAGFMGAVIFTAFAPMRRILYIVGLGFFYSLFIVGFCLAFGEWWPMLAFWLLILNRLMSGISTDTQNEEKKKFVFGMWGVSAACYLLCVFATTLLPLPEFGITPSVISSLHLSGGGVWIDEPYRVLAFGWLYFTAVGYFEFIASRWVHKVDTSSFNNVYSQLIKK